MNWAPLVKSQAEEEVDLVCFIICKSGPLMVKVMVWLILIAFFAGHKVTRWLHVKSRLVVCGRTKTQCLFRGL